jgi:sugar lactone lactonase YvrE
LNQPTAVATDGSGNLLIADFLSVRSVNAKTGIITTVAGNGTFGAENDGPAATAELDQPAAVAIDAGGNVLVADTNNERVRRVDAQTGIITTVAGTFNSDDSLRGDRPATKAKLGHPEDVAVDASGNLFIASDLVWRVDAKTVTITVVPGNISDAETEPPGDGGPANRADLNNPTGLALDGTGNLFVALETRIRRVDAATRIITTVAGNGTLGFTGDGGVATRAELSSPSGIAINGSGDLFIADLGNNRIRRVDAKTGIITTVAGNGTPGFTGDGGAATNAELRSPSGVAINGSGDLFIADCDNNRIRRVDAKTGIITTVAGNGTPGFTGDGGPATSAELRSPRRVAISSSGVLFIADRENNRIRQVGYH